jgi:hypothetical protein
MKVQASLVRLHQFIAENMFNELVNDGRVAPRLDSSLLFESRSEAARPLVTWIGRNHILNGGFVDVLGVQSHIVWKMSVPLQRC